MCTMTKLLEEAISAAVQLPEADQDAVASLIRAELDAEKRWQEALARDPEKLRRLADQARADIQAGRTKPMDLD